MGLLIFLQNGHRRTRFAITTPDSICIFAIDLGLRHSGRIGGAAGSLSLSLPIYEAGDSVKDLGNDKDISSPYIIEFPRKLKDFVTQQH